MLRNRSRAAVSTKQALVSDHTTVSPPTRDHTPKPVSSFLASPRFFRGLLTKMKGGRTDDLMNPTSTLDVKPTFFFLDNPFEFNKNKNIQNSPRTSARKRPWETSNSTAVGLALITSPDETPAGKQHKPGTRMVIFGSPPSMLSPADSQYSPSDFGIKTRNQQLCSPRHVFQTRSSPPVTASRLSVAEMELSEDYTRVISHGPNPTTTHIFDNCIVESRAGAHAPLSTSAKTKRNFVSDSLSDSFLSNCYTCKRSLSHKQDIYIYRGEKAFCSQACRLEEMLKDGADYPFMDDDAAAYRSYY
uniref:FLZ-type domain-containing protein n=1 Tax=Kalanchoe fedtschenkoi TaxID=63787 RepID=A0A7N0ZVR0_KALFE